MRRVVSFLITVYATVPVILYLFPWILRYAIFCHLWRSPFFVDLSRPEDVLNHTCNFYLDTEADISVGVWHTLPASQWEKAVGRSPEWYKETLGDGNPVIIYFHGNAGTRALNHRVELVKVFGAAGYHVFSFDYRDSGGFDETIDGQLKPLMASLSEITVRQQGFGDSTGEPSEAGLTNDALYLYHWVKKQSRGPVYVWGHSLGSGVAINAALKIQEQGSVVDALIIDGAFTSPKEVIASYLIFKMYKFLPGFEGLFWNIMEKNKIAFRNDKNLKSLNSPLLILHAEDDNIVPYHMGLKLYEISLKAKKEYDRDVQVEMITYNADLGYAHNFIYLDPNLSNVVGKFLQNLRR